MADETPRALLRAVEARDGLRCAWHGENTRDGRCRPATLVPQHRQGGMGGRADKHRLSNVVLICSWLNGIIEADPMWQAQAVDLGFKIADAAEPTREPIRHAAHGLVLLDDEGGVEWLRPQW